MRCIEYADLSHLFWSGSLPALLAPPLRWYKVNKMISPIIRVGPDINQDQCKSTNVNNQSISKHRPRLRVSLADMMTLPTVGISTLVLKRTLDISSCFSKNMTEWGDVGEEDSADRTLIRRWWWDYLVSKQTSAAKPACLPQTIPVAIPVSYTHLTLPTTPYV